jgi:hypothetical protein
MLITESRTMRAKLLVGFVMIAAGAPLCAQADTVSKTDLWNSWGAGPAEPLATHARVARQSDPAFGAIGESAIGESRTIRAVDTDMPRVFVAGTTAPSRAVQATAAPEINAGFAATGLTLLLGGVAVLRGGRSRANG